MDTTAQPARAKRQPRQLNETQLRALGTLYDVHAENPEKRITLVEHFDKAAAELDVRGLLTKFSSPDHRPTYQITDAGRRRYEELEPTKAADSRVFWLDKSGDRALAILRDLGYRADRDGHDVAFKIAIGEASHLLSQTEASSLIACPLQHPLSLADYRHSGAGMTWYSFPEEA